MASFHYIPTANEANERLCYSRDFDICFHIVVKLTTMQKECDIFKYCWDANSANHWQANETLFHVITLYGIVSLENVGGGGGITQLPLLDAKDQLPIHGISVEYNHHNFFLIVHCSEILDNDSSRWSSFFCIPYVLPFLSWLWCYTFQRYPGFDLITHIYPIWDNLSLYTVQRGQRWHPAKPFHQFNIFYSKVARFLPVWPQNLVSVAGVGWVDWIED